MAHMPFTAAWSIGTAPRSEQPVSDVPGPGTYDQHSKDRSGSPKWSLKFKNPTDSAFYTKYATPPPGHYETPTTLKISKPIKKPKEYNLLGDKPKTLQRYYSGSNVTLPSSIDTRKGHFFGYRFDSEVPDLSPGPAYNINQHSDSLRKTKIKNKSSGFGFGSRDAIYKSQATCAPGPGSYNKQNLSPSKKLGGSIVFARDERKFCQASSTNPDLGPGSYNPMLPETSKGCKLLGRHKQIKGDVFENIGPGSYKIPSPQSPTPVKIVDSIKKQFRNSADQTPSPFQYEPKRFPEAFRSNKGFRMGYAERRILHPSDTPGPGVYDIPTSLSKQGVIIATKLKSPTGNSNNNRSNIDDFNSSDKEKNSSFRDVKYDYVSHKAPAFSFPTEPLEHEKQKSMLTTAGPGTYNIQKNLSAKGACETYSLGKAQRFKNLAEGETPYFEPHIPSTIGYIPQYLLNGKRSHGSTMNSFT